MKILYCEINKVPVTTILDSVANCNIIAEEVVNELGLEIDDISDVEVYTPIGKLDVVGVIREIPISILSQGPKWKQVKITDVFVTNKPEFDSVLILGQPWFQENAMKTNFQNKTLTLLDGTDIQLVIGPRIYIDHLNIILTGPTDIQKFRSGDLRQGDDSIIEYYTQVKKYNKLAGYNEDQLKYQFLRGLSPDNQLEARRCGTDLSLDELVAKLSVVENIRKIKDICV